MTSAFTCTCRRPSGGIRCGGIGATRRPGVLEMLIRTSIVTGSPFATVSSSGASELPQRVRAGRLEHADRVAELLDPGSRGRGRRGRRGPGRPCQVADAGRSRPCSQRRRTSRRTWCRRPVSRHRGGARGRARPHASRGPTRAPWRGISAADRPAAGPRGAGPHRAVVGPAATTSREAARARTRPVSSSRFTVASSAPAPVVVRAPHGAAARGRSGARWPVASRTGRGTRARRPRPGWPGRRRSRRRRGRADTVGAVPGIVGLPMPPGASAARASRGSVSTASRRRRTAADRRPAPHIPAAWRPGPRPPLGGVQQHGARAGVGDVGERRFVEHSPAGPGGGIAAPACREASVTTWRPRRRRPAGRGRRAARGPARRGRRRRTAARRRSCRARPPPAWPATARDLGAGAADASRSGRAPRSPAASPQRSRRGRDRRPGRWPPDGRPRGALASANAATSPPSRPSGASERARSSSASSVGSPGTGRQPVRGVDQRVEHGQAGRAGPAPWARPGRRGRARACRQRQHRQQQAGGGQAGARPSRGTPLTLTSSSYTPGRSSARPSDRTRRAAAR